MRKLILYVSVLSLLWMLVAPVGAAQIYVDNPTGNTITVAKGLIPIDIYAKGEGEEVGSINLYLSVTGDAGPPLITSIIVDAPGMLFQPPLFVADNFPLTGGLPSTQAAAGALATIATPRVLVPGGTKVATVTLDTSLLAANGHWQLKLTQPQGNDTLYSGFDNVTVEITGLTLTGGNLTTQVPEPSTIMLGAILGALALPLVVLRRVRAKQA
jgi:hypothetical protein